MITMFILGIILTLNVKATDVKVEITTYPTSFTPGESQTNAYVFVVSKVTPADPDVTGIEVTADFNPNTKISGLSWSCVASGNSVCGANGGMGSISSSTTVNLIGTGSVEFTFSNVTIAADVFTNMDFNVSINADVNVNTDNTASNDSDSETINRASVTDITMSLNDGFLQYTPGTTNRDYTVTVANNGPSEATAIQFGDSINPGFLITGWTCATDSGSGCSSAGASNANVNPTFDLKLNEIATLVVTADFASSAIANPMEYTTSATVTDLEASDPTPASVTDANTRAPQSNLAIEVNTLISTDTEYTPGLGQTYEVVVTNNGPSDVSGVTVVDNNLTDFSMISWSCTADPGSSCPLMSNTRLNSTADIESGDSVTFTVTVTYDSGATIDPIIYQVEASNPMGVSGTSPINDSKSLIRNAISNLAVTTLTDSATTYVPGLSGTFTAVITNNGPSDVSGVTIVDNDSGEFENISWSCTVVDANSDCIDDTAMVAINTTVDLVANDAATFLINVDYDSSARSNPLVYSITAENPAGVNGTSPVTATDNDDILDRQVSLSITKSSEIPNDAFFPNEPFTYLIVVTNNGPSDLGTPGISNIQPPTPAENGVNLTDMLDPILLDHPTLCNNIDINNEIIHQPCWEYCDSDGGVNNSTLTPDSADCSAPRERVTDFGTSLNLGLHLSSGSSTEIRVHTRIIDGTNFSDCDSDNATINSVCNDATITIVSSNTSTAGTNPITVSTSNEIVIGTDLLVTKTDNKTNITPGTQNSYEITVRNDGFINAQGITVEDILPLYTTTPAGFIPGSISWVCETSDSGACCNSQSSGMTCGLNSPTSPIISDVLSATIDLDSQSELTFTIIGDIHPNATGTLTNSATATLDLNSNITEVNPLNNTNVTDTTTLSAVADIAVTKTIEFATINASDSSVTDLTYKIKVENFGPSNASSINVVDLLNSPKLNLSTVSWTCTVTGNGNCTTTGPIAGTEIDTNVSLENGSHAIFIATISTMSNAQGKVLNTAIVTNTEFDPVMINNNSTAEFSLTGTAQLTIDNDDGRTTATPGLSTGYTIKITNQGPDDVFGATVKDVFPPQLTDVEWTCSAISPIPGDLTFFQRSDVGAAGTHMVTSPDDQHVYMTSTTNTDGNGEKIYIFSRNINPGSNFGQLQLIENINQDDGGVDVLEDAGAIRISQSGQHLYVLSKAASSIAIYSRDTNSASTNFGRLTFQGIMTTNIPTNPIDLLITNDQEYVYVTGDDMIEAYSRDLGNGSLQHSHSKSQTDAGVMAQNSDGSQIYVMDDVGNNANAYNRIAAGDLTSINSITHSDIDAISDITISNDGKTIYLTATGSGKVVLLNRNTMTGSLSYNIAYTDTTLLLNPGETLAGLSSIEISNDNQHIIIGNPAQNSLISLGRNSQGLLFRKEIISIAGLESVQDVSVTADGKHVMTTASGTGGKTLTAFKRRQPDPQFSFIEAELNGVNDSGDTGDTVNGLLDASAITISSDGKHVYALGLADNSVAVFDRNKTKGSTAATRQEHLSFNTHYTDGVDGVTHITDGDSIALTADGNFLYIGSSNQSTLAVFARMADGTLNYVTSYQHTINVTDGLLGINAIVTDSSNQHLYIAGRFEASIAHYTIQGNGSLSLIDTVANGDIGVSGLAGARSLVISPDGKHIISANSIDDSVVVLTRDPMNGEINFLQQVAGVGNQPMDIAISPDGEHVYVVAANDHRLTVLKRNSNQTSTAFGRLNPITSYSDGVDGFNLLQGLRTIAISSDGEKVYVGAEFDNAISVMDRNKNPNSSSFGRLSLVSTSQDDTDGVNGLNQIYDLVVSDDTKHVYAAGFADNAVAAFILGSGSRCSALGTGNINEEVDIGSNGTLTYTINAKIKSNATGTLLTEASITPPANFTVISPVDNCTISADNNCDDDTTSLVPVNDLTITKTDNKLSVIAGQPVQYEIVVSNNGPSDAVSTAGEIIMVKDVLGSDFEASSVNWSCEATGSGSLSYVQSIIDGENSITGLQGVSSLTVSADLVGLGSHVLASSVLDNSLTAFSINPLNGELTQAAITQAGAGANINGARDVLVIDNDIYVASQVDDSLVAFKAVNNIGLDLQWIENHNFSTGVNGLNQAVALIASPNGMNIYVAGANDNAIVVFNRNLMTGALTLETTYSEGDVNGSLGLNGVNALAISSDGNSVYTSGINNGTIGVYERDLVTGTLTFKEVINSNNTAVDMSGISAINLADDGEHVYLTSAANNAIYVFKRKTDVPTTDFSFGTLSLQQEISNSLNNINGLLSPSDITISIDGRHAYVSSEQSDSVLWFARNLVSGDLTFAGLVSNLLANVDGLDGALSVSIDNTDKYLYVAGSLDNAISAFSRTDDSFCPAGGVGDIAIDTGTDIVGVAVDVAVNGSLVFTVDATVAPNATGTLVNTANVYSCTQPVSLPLITNCPGSDSDTSNNSASDTDTLNPTADLLISKTDGISQYDGLRGAIKVTGNNQHLYVAAKAESAISIWSRENDNLEPGFGELSYISRVENGINGISGLLGISDVLLSNDGLTLYAAGSNDNSIVVFRRNTFDGSLELLEKHTSGIFGIVGIEGIKSLTISEDGAHLYATGPLTNSLVVFSIDTSIGINHGRLTHIQHLQNAVNSVSGLVAVSDVDVSQDDMHVYVSSKTENSISVFLRNPNTASLTYGELSYLTTYTDGVDGVAGITGASALTLNNANGGEFLYVLGAANQALAVFSRESTTGELTFIEFKQNGTSNVEGLDFAEDLILSTDESTLYVAGSAENTLVHFDRNSSNGTLSFGSAIHDGDALAQPGEFVNGLNGVSGLFITGDDSHVYAAAVNDDSLTVFNRDSSGLINQNGTLEFLQVLIDEQGGVSPGTEISYTITVNNIGPSNVEKAVITDIFPTEFEQISYQCFNIGGASCDNNVQSGNVNVLANIPVNGSIEIIATGVIRSDASGILSNTATVSSSTDPNFAFTDPDPTNNSATDDNTVLSPAVNLIVTKDNGVTEVVPGDPVTYTIVVANDAPMPGNNKPADISSVFVTDLIPESIVNVSWSCQAFPQPGLLDDGDNDDMTNTFINYNDLTQHKQMVINNSGTKAYVIGIDSGIDSILVYDRDARTGELVEIQRLSNGIENVTGLLGGADIIISNDGKNLYATATDNDALLTFSIEPTSGELSYVNTHVDGLNGINGLGGAKALIASTDGRHLYVAGKLDNAIAIFNRDVVSGLLSYNNVFTGVEGLNGVEALAFEATEQYLLVVAEANNSLASYARNSNSGLLSEADVEQDFLLPGSVLDQPQDVIVNDNKIFVASFTSNAISVFDIDLVDGSMNLTQVIRHMDTGVPSMQGPVSLLIGGSKEELYVASNSSETITLFDINDGVLSPLTTLYDIAIIPGLDNLGLIVTDPESNYLYALSDDLVLTSIQKGSHCTETGTGHLNDVANISSGGRIEYMISGEVLPTATGTLTNTATAIVGSGFVELFPLDNTATDVDLLTPISDLSVSKTDNLIEVVAGTSSSYSISSFSAGPSTITAEISDNVPTFPTENAGFDASTITFQCSTNKTLQFNVEYSVDANNGLQDVSDAIVTKNGLFAYTISPTDASVSLFSRNISGELTFISKVSENDVLAGGTVTGLSGASSLIFDQTEGYLYVSGETDNTIVIFSQDNLTGELDFVQSITSGVDGVFGLTNPVKMVITPDNTGLYVAAKGSDAITVFIRNTLTGELQFVERVRDGFGTIVPQSNVIIGITDLAVSADGNYLYTVADFSDTIAVFSRDESTNILSFVTVIRSGDDHNGTAVAGLNGVQSITISPNGNYLYVVATLDASILTFARDLTDGSLVFQSVISHGDMNSGEIAEPTSIDLSPDGDRIIVTDAASHSVNIYDRNLSNGSIELLDVFTNNLHGSSLLLAPKTFVNDGVNILAISQAASSLVALRVTAHAECIQPTLRSSSISTTLFMNPGSAGGMEIQALVHPSARGIINNTATIAPLFGARDNNLVNNSSTDQTQIIIETDVAIVKTAPANAFAGETIQYSLVLTNTGPSDALDVVVEDTLDAVIINSNWNCTATGRSLCNDATGTGDLNTTVNVGIDGQITIVINATINPAYIGQLDNTANTIVMEEGYVTDTNLSNNSSSTSTTVTRLADVQVTKTNLLSEVVAGEIITYEIVVTNNGPSDAPNTIINDSIPASLSNVTWNCATSIPSTCNTNGNGDINETIYVSTTEPLTYTLQGLLASGATGVLTNTVTATVAVDVPDSDGSNNTATDSDPITLVSDMLITMTQELNPYDPASHVKLPIMLNVTNIGPSDAENVTAVFDTDANYNWQPLSGCTNNGSQISCDFGYTTANQSMQIPLSFDVLEPTPSNKNNTASVSTTTFDPNLTNNSVTQTIDFLTGIDVRTSKSDGRDVVGPGQVLRYLIVIENIGSIDAGDVDIIENLPTELVSASWTCEAFNGASCINIDEFGITGSANIPAASRVELRLIATVDPALTPNTGTPFTNSVDALLVTETDFNLMNNTASDTDIIISVIFVDDFE